MDYAFRHNESTREGVRRIAAEQLERAVEELSPAGGASDEAIHEVRKRMKKLRGLLRLVQHAIDHDVFSAENACYRDAARHLASARRTLVIVETFDALVAIAPAALDGAAIGAWRSTLLGARARAAEQLHEASHAAEVAEVLRQALARLDSWALEDDGWDALGAGYAGVYRRARRAFRKARRVTNTENLHAWRRWAKYHFYHVRLLHRVWPETERALADALEALGETLGVEHDLDDLRLALIDKPAPAELAAATTALLERLSWRREELRATAFSLGARIFVESPRAAARRVRGYYAAWQSEAPLPPSSDDDESDA